MSEIITVGLDLAKNVFQVHGTDGAGRAVLRKKIRRGQVLEFFSQLPSCVVAMEACGGAHFWGREIGKLGHEVRLIPPAYVKPFVKRQKNDMADAEAICEAAMRPTMRFVPVKSEETQGAAMVFRVRELLIRQRTQAINALRGHLTEFGQIVPQGAANAARLIAIVEDPDGALPADAVPTLKALIAALTHLEAEIRKLDAEITRRAKENDVARRLMTVPGIGPLIATAIAVLAPPPETFRKARDFAAWLGLVPRQHSTGGKQRLDSTGIKVEGEGEWNARKHGGTKRRVWRKIHIGIDEKTLEIRAAEFTTSDIGDAPMLPELLDQIPPDQEIASVTADGAFDTRKCHEAVAARGAAAIIPPRKNAKPWKPDTAGAVARNDALRASQRFGRTIWRRWSGYHRRSRAETKMHCVKLLGQRLSARDFDRQVAEFQVRVAVLNGFTALGIPVTEAVG